MQSLNAPARPNTGFAYTLNVDAMQLNILKTLTMIIPLFQVLENTYGQMY